MEGLSEGAGREGAAGHFSLAPPPVGAGARELGMTLSCSHSRGLRVCLGLGCPSVGPGLEGWMLSEVSAPLPGVSPFPRGFQESLCNSQHGFTSAHVGGKMGEEAF